MLMDAPLERETSTPAISAEELLALAKECGADNAGLVSVDNPLVAEDRPFILRAFPAARTLLGLHAHAS